MADAEARLVGGTAPVYRWRGDYFGFISGGWLYDREGAYRGWCEADGSVWHADGRPLGDLVDGCYVLKNLRRCPPVRRTPRITPLPAPVPRPPGSRLARQPRPGWADALDGLAVVPLAGDLQGRWVAEEGCLELLGDGGFRWGDPGGAASTGRWSLAGRRLALEIAEGPGAGDLVGLQVLLFDREGETLSLRWSEGRSLPFTLRRKGLTDRSAVAQPAAGDDGALPTNLMEKPDA